MKIDYLKEKTELISVVLLGVSAILAISIFVKITGFFTASAKAEKIVNKAIEQNTEDATDIDKYFAKYKMLADALKKNNLFAPPPAKQHPVREVTGIFGDEAIINGKLYQAGDKVADATIVSIEATQVTIEWDGKKKTFSPIDAGSSSQPGRPGGSRSTARGRPPSPGSSGGPQMVTVQSQGRPGGPTGGPRGGMGPMMGRFQNMSESERRNAFSEMQKRREQYLNMSDAEREKFRAEMRERFGGGRPPGGGRGPGGGDGRRGGR